MQSRPSRFQVPNMMNGIKWLLIINVAVFIFQHLVLKAILFENGMSGFLYFRSWFALFPVEAESFQIWQFLTFQFLHGSFLHLLMNMLLLWMIGTVLERVWGTRNFLIFYLLCGVAAGVGQITVSSFVGEQIPLVGASGGIFGIIVGFGLTFPNEFIYVFFRPVRVLVLMWILIGLQVLNGLFSYGDNVSHVGHLGGAAMGFFLMYNGERFGIYRFFNSAIDVVRDVFKGFSRPSGRPAPRRRQQAEEVRPDNVFSIDDAPRKKTTPAWFRPQPKKSEPTSNEITPEEIDAILDKMNESTDGYKNLTDREKRILEEYSRNL